MTKYSLKNISLGIGVGLILASMANISAAPKSLSVEEIKREAAKHNLMVIAAKELINKQPEADKKNEGQQTENKPPTQSEAGIQNTTVEITVSTGATSENIAELLISKKLINDKQIFLDRLKELKKESKIQTGTFKIPVGSTLDSIIEIITISS